MTIIHIINHPPAYAEYYNHPRPVWNWDTPNNSWVGIGGYDWADLLANEVSQLTKEFVHEIWQPDLRADKIYSQEIFPGVIHRLFPATERNTMIGLKKSREISSICMVKFLSVENGNQIIFHIGQSVTLKINRDLLEHFSKARFIFSFHGQITLPIISFFKIQLNFLAKVHYLKEHFLAKKLFQRISFLTYQSETNLDWLKFYYTCPKAKITMGIHFDNFKGFSKNQCRNELNLPKNKTILLSVCRLYGLKQIDKITEILSTIEKDFLYIVVGHGNRYYEEYLKRKAKKLIEQNKIMFAGYKTGQELVQYYNSADLFIHVSKAEAGPVVNMEAMACGVPIFCTDTGSTAEVLKENNAGMVVAIHNYKEWKVKLIDFLRGKPIKALDIEVVKEHYDWGDVSRKIINIYKTLK